MDKKTTYFFIFRSSIVLADVAVIASILFFLQLYHNKSPTDKKTWHFLLAVTKFLLSYC